MTNIFSDLPANIQMILLRADLRTIRQARGPLRKGSPFVRAHFWNRLMDAKRAKAA